jgi:signal transduction histidine kinase
MKKIISLFLLAIFCFYSQIYAQNRAGELMQQAQENLDKKEYIKARYLFLQAYNSFASQDNYAKAVECGVNASALYHRENYYKEAFDLLRSAEMAVTTGEQKTGKAMPELRFRINKERLQIYINTKNPARAKELLSRLEETAKASRNDSLSNDLLYTQANYYYTFGMNTQGDAATNRLISQYKEQKNYAKVDECYKTLISIARKANNAGVVARTYDKYILWTDSVKALTAQDELNALKQKYDESLTTIQEKDDSLSAKQYIIIGLCVLAAILAAALVLGAIVLLRFIVLTRKQKKAISVANEHNELKTKFIQNISAQMEPTLNTLDASLPGVRALHTFSQHIQELSELENSLSEPYEMQEKNISTFCENVMDKIKGKTQEEVTLAVNAPKLNVKINPEQLEHILLHLLENAAEYTPAGGKIWLDFKKRGAHTHQFIISDTGCGIPEEQRENIFKPFTEVKDLTQGDGLGLPICSLIATKMNGSLTLDSSYNKGARFVLELHA